MALCDYVHGYSGKEEERLVDQANTLSQLLHHDTSYPVGSTVLEAGCGVGAQTVILASRSPGAHFTSIDISEVSLESAKSSVKRLGLINVALEVGDIFHLSYKSNSFDHIFICFLLEHLPQPLAALEKLKVVLKPGGTITVIEGDHGSAFFYPESEFAQRAIQCLVQIQSESGGNARIGRQLYPLISQAGFKNIQVTPRHVYADAGRPDWVSGFTKNTFNAMIEGAREQALNKGLCDLSTWNKGIADLHETEGPNGTFSYTFFKAVAVK